MPRKEINKACHFVCEGPSDQGFLQGLLKHLNIDNTEVHCARTDGAKGCTGKSGFTDTLRSLVGVSQLGQNFVKRILIVCDSDDDPDLAVKEAGRYLKEAKLPVPERAREMATARGEISTSIMTLPLDEKGTIEGLLCDVARSTLPDLVGPVAKFCDDTNHRTKDWSPAKRCKMRLRCYIAAHWENDPDQSLTWLLKKENQKIIDFDAPELTEVSNFVKSFCNET